MIFLAMMLVGRGQNRDRGFEIGSRYLGEPQTPLGKGSKKNLKSVEISILCQMCLSEVMFGVFSQNYFFAPYKGQST